MHHSHCSVPVIVQALKIDPAILLLQEKKVDIASLFANQDERDDSIGSVYLSIASSTTRESVSVVLSALRTSAAGSGRERRFSHAPLRVVRSFRSC
jgi:hypothetical protein